VRTFTIGFREAGYDEADHAGAIARHLGTDHTELYLTPQDALDVVPLLPRMYDEPFADPSAIPTYLVSKLARSQVTVALSGDGGDELFGGYDRYHHTAALWRLTRRIPRPLRRGLAAGLRPGIGLALERLFHPVRSLLPAVMRKDLAQKLSRVADFVRRDNALEAYRSLMSLWDMGSEEVEAGAAFGEHALPDRTLVEQLMYVDALTYLPDDILVKLDRASMAVSLESRVPFLDHRFVELSWRIPIELKTVEGSTKWPLRQVLFEHVPRELVNRPKQGFAVPIGAWLRGPLKGWALDMLQGERVRQTALLDEPRVARWLDEHLTGTRNWEHHLWRALMLLAWHQESRTRAAVVGGAAPPACSTG
jgi:asparagine synthase (glutamine-hydrolysing)